MSQLCPTCGNIKLSDSLFCDDCTKKIRTEYEVNVPEKSTEVLKPATHEEQKIDIEKDLYSVEPNDPVNPDNSNDSVNWNDSVNRGNYSKQEPDNEKDYNENDYDNGSGVPLGSGAPLKETNIEEKDYYKYAGPTPTKRGKNPFKTFLWVVVSIAVLIGAFFVYNKTVRQKNLERSAWESAIKLNSVDGYLAYIVSHPSGEHLNEAQNGLLRLKEQEASSWERMKETGSVSELRSFLQQYTTSPYVPLVKNRLDSLSWMIALNSNSADSFNEYINLSNRGELNGTYLSEAENRYKMLNQSTPIDNETLTSLRSTVNGFYSALTSLDHSGMFNVLAPHVHRFFDSGGASREKITGELLVTAAQSGGSRITFTPSSEDLKYENSTNGGYTVNIPVTKSFTINGESVQVPGYIAHIDVNQDFHITGIYETKPYHGAP